MPQVYKVTLIFQFTPQSEIWNVATPPRAAGWTESVWASQNPPIAGIGNWANLRANAMATDCSIVGYRVTPYTYTGNKLIPGKSAVGVINRQGIVAGYTNSPDDTLRFLVTAGAVPATFEYMARAVPDAWITSNQYQTPASGPDPMAALARFLANAIGPQVQVLWLGRDPTQIAQRVLSVNGATSQVKCQATLGVIANANFVRLRRVYDDVGNPIKGSFLCTLVTANADGSFTYTLAGLPNQTRSTPSGTARLDQINSSPCTAATYRELSSRKVGRPFFLFRGRRTKQRV